MSYRNILTLIINHPYYKNGCCRNFHIQPDPVTSTFIQKNRIIIRYILNSWRLFTDIDIDKLWIPDEFADKLHCTLTMSSSDNAFYASIKEHDKSSSINCICNKNEISDLVADACTETDCINWKKQSNSPGKMDWTICIFLKKYDLLKDSNVYTVSFNVKDTYWKYIVCTLIGQETITVLDTDSIVSFKSGGIEEFPNSKKALTFVSNSKIPLSEHDQHNFRLVVKKGNIEKTLIKRLPVATASGIHYLDSAKKDLVSLIFINT